MTLKTIMPDDVAKQLEYKIGLVGKFAADLLEVVDDQNIADALRAAAVDEYDLACAFLKLERDKYLAGHMTDKLRKRREELLADLEVKRAES